MSNRFLDSSIQGKRMGQEANVQRNRGELSEGWYDPETLRKALVSATEAEGEMGAGKEGSDSEEEIGPALPGQGREGGGRMGPSIPSLQDLELKRGM